MHVTKIRRWLYTHLEPSAWGKAGLSPLNLTVSILIVLATLLAILETEPVVRQWAPVGIPLLEVAFAFVFLVEYVARIMAAGENPRYQGFRGRIRFMMTPWAIIDLLAILPFILSIGAVNSFSLRLIKLFRLVRLAKLGRFSTAMTDIYKAVSARSYELIISLMVAGLLLILSSSVIYVLEAPHQPDDFGSIPRALWWSVATLTTVGYGDITPITAWGRLFAGITAVIGIGMIAMPTGILAAAFSDAMQQKRNQSGG